MASEIHKKRTGKGLKITEEVVLKEEMYEEDKNDLLHSYHPHSPNLEMPYTDGHTRLETCSSKKAKMSQMLARANDEWRENEINRLFAQCFPNTVLAAQDGPQLMLTAATYQQSPRRHCQATYPSSYSPSAGIAAQVGPSPPLAYNSHRPWMSPSTSITGSLTKETIQSIDSTISPWPPAVLIPHSKYIHTT